MKFDFTDKSSYLAWRQEWRTNYAQLSQEIRGLKRKRKMFLNHYRWYVSEQGPVWELVSREPNPEYGNASGLRVLQQVASFQMERLLEAKELSWRLRQARLNAETV